MDVTDEDKRRILLALRSLAEGGAEGSMACRKVVAAMDELGLLAKKLEQLGGEPADMGALKTEFSIRVLGDFEAMAALGALALKVTEEWQ